MAGNPLATERTNAHGALQSAPDGGFVPSRLADGEDAGVFLNDARAAFRDFVTQQEFPCVGARAAFNSESYALATYPELASATGTRNLSRDLHEFVRSDLQRESEYATFVAVFRQPTTCGEHEFEQLLWSQLQQLNHLDAAESDWDPDVQSDPTDAQFSFSFAGQALYVIGMHPNSSRLARQFPYACLIFNPHEQFQRLRADGKWKRMQQTIRERDMQLQGSINPMLSDFGESSEARQYSGRAVEQEWRAPFEAVKPAAAGKCPFHH